MPFVSVTRARIRSWWFVPSFLVEIVRTRRQLRRAKGFHGGAVLADRRWTFWTMTAWDSEASMRGYIMAGAHRQTMPRFAAWCDEASVVHWEQTATALPSWPEADRRMRASGRASQVLHPSAEHSGLKYREPRTSGAAAIRPRSESS